MATVEFANVKLTVQALKNINEIAKAIGTPGSAPPEKGVVLLGYDADNNVVRRVRVTQDGNVVAWLG